MERTVDPRLLAVVERVTVPVVLLAVLGTVGFFGATSLTPLAEVFWVMYALLWVVSLLFVAWFERRTPESSALETVDPVALLQTRYAAGEIDEATFERMLDTLLDDERPGSPSYRQKVLDPEL
jgi:uncharacterized membrane protein